MTWMDALAELDSLGYVLSLDGEKVRYAYQGGGNPNAAQIIPLFETIKARKALVVEHLKRLADFEAMFNQALAEINCQYESGTIPYIRENYPALWQRIIENEARLNDLWLAGETGPFKLAVEEWKNLSFQTIKIFQAREAQESLFRPGEP
jgi:hypothetical protein